MQLSRRKEQVGLAFAIRVVVEQDAKPLQLIPGFLQTRALGRFRSRPGCRRTRRPPPRRGAGRRDSDRRWRWCRVVGARSMCASSRSCAGSCRHGDDRNSARARRRRAGARRRVAVRWNETSRTVTSSPAAASTSASSAVRRLGPLTSAAASAPSARCSCCSAHSPSASPLKTKNRFIRSRSAPPPRGLRATRWRPRAAAASAGTARTRWRPALRRGRPYR